MTTAEWCILGAVALYLGTIAPFKAAGHRDFNNADPRASGFYERPIRKRALGAHTNGIETFPFFAVAVLLAQSKGAPQDWVDLLAVGFLLSRCAFVAAYLADAAAMRTALWNVAFAFNLAIFLSPALDLRGLWITMSAGVGWAAALWVLLSVMNTRRASVEVG